MRGPKVGSAHRGMESCDEPSGFALGLGQADWALAFLPLTALLEELDAFESLHDGTFAESTTFDFETAVFGHKIGWFGCGITVGNT